MTRFSMISAHMAYWQRDFLPFLDDHLHGQERLKWTNGCADIRPSRLTDVALPLSLTMKLQRAMIWNREKNRNRTKLSVKNYIRTKRYTQINSLIFVIFGTDTFARKSVNPPLRYFGTSYKKAEEIGSSSSFSRVGIKLSLHHAIYPWSDISLNVSI